MVHPTPIFDSGSGSSKAAGTASGATEFNIVEWDFDEGSAEDLAEARQKSMAKLKELAGQGWRVIGYSAQTTGTSSRYARHRVLLQRN